MHITELNIFPVKSMTPQSMEAIDLTPDGRAKGDRVLGFRFKDAGEPDDWTWQTKNNFVGLVNTPGLATLNVEFDPPGKRLRISTDELTLAEGRVDVESDRAEIERNFSDYVQTIDPNPFTGHPERFPATLLGDGEQPLFHDSAAGLVTLYSAESLAALADSLDDSELNGLRFRANIVVTGLSEPFEELSWVGRRVCIGNTEFEVVKTVTRCLVTHANPITGLRDHDIMNTLVERFTPENPQFSITLSAKTGDRTIRSGDDLHLIDE